MDILHPKVQQRQQHDYRFLLVPGNVKGDRQLIDVRQAEHFLQFQRDHRQRIGVVALSGIQHTGDPADVAQVQFVIAVFCATRGEDHSILGQFLGKFRVILAALHTPVAAGHYKELADRAALDSLHHLVRERDHLLVGKSADNAACFNRFRCGKRFGQFDNLRKIFVSVRICHNMPAPRVTGGACGKDSIPYLVAAGRHDAVGGKQDRAVERTEFLRLFPPGVTVITRKVGILLKRRVIMGGEHFAVRIHIHAGALRLLQ